MVYNTHNYLGSGLCPSSGILKTRKHVSEVLRSKLYAKYTFLCPSDKAERKIVSWRGRAYLK
jgi:hypothetical protein